MLCLVVFSLNLLLDVYMAHYPCMYLIHIIHFPVLSIEVSAAIQHLFPAGGFNVLIYVIAFFSQQRDLVAH